MLISTNPKENAPGGESPEALDQKPHLAMEITEMTHDTRTQPQAQLFALVRARSDAAFQRFMRDLLSVSPKQGQRFDVATVEGFRHA